MQGTFRHTLLTSCLLLSLPCAALAQGGPASTLSADSLAKPLTSTKGTPVAGSVRAIAEWRDPEPTAAQSEALRSRNSNLADMAESLAHERRQTDAIAQELAAARQELEVTKQHAAIALREAAETAQTHMAELSKAHVEEQQRAQALAQDLAVARQELETARAQILAVQQEQQKAVAAALQEEQKKSAQLARSLATARRELKAAKQHGVAATKQSAETDQAQLVQAGDALAPEPTAVRSRVEATTRQGTRARHDTKEADEVRAARPSGAGAAPGTSAVTDQQPTTPRQFEWE